MFDNHKSFQPQANNNPNYYALSSTISFKILKESSDYKSNSPDYLIELLSDNWMIKCPDKILEEY
jgi:hypothetical protein